MRISSKLVGAGGGFLVGLLFVIAGWRIALILLAFLVAGLLVGVLFEERHRAARRVRDWFERLPRS